MRSVTLSGRTFTVSPLTGGDIKRLKSQGVDLVSGAYSIAEGMDAVLAAAGFGAERIDDLPFPDILSLHKAVMGETFGVAEEEKN